MSDSSLAILTSHPTQFDSPLFTKMARSCSFDLTVYYLETDDIARQVDRELGFSPNWDIPLLSGYRSIVCPHGFMAKVRFLRRECFSKAHYDLVVVPGYARLDLTLLAQLCRRQPLGMRLDTAPIYAEPRWKTILRKLILKKIFRRYAVFHPVGSLTEGFLRELGVSASRMFRLPYAVDTEFLHAGAERFRKERDWHLAELGICTGTFVVLGVLKFVPRENPLELLRGFGLFHERFPNSALILVGTGPLQKEIQHYLEAMKLSEAARLAGYSKYSDLPKWYGISNVFVHPATVEPWGVSVNEAMACGLPVVASDRVGASYDLVVQDLNGYRYRGGHLEELADCLAKIASRPDQGREMGRASRNIILNWGHEASITALNAAVRKMVGVTAARPSNEQTEVSKP